MVVFKSLPLGLFFLLFSISNRLFCQQTDQLFKGNNPRHLQTLIPACVDSSYKKVFEAADRSSDFLCSAKTNDGGILLGGFGRNRLSSPPLRWYAIITKFDNSGNHIWSKELRSDIYYSMYIESIKELSDGSIIVAGWHDNSIYTASDSSDLFVAKLSSTGNLVWLKTFRSSLNNNCSIHNIRFVSIAEGVNGDLLIAGTATNCPYPRHLTIFKLDNSGIVQWKYSYLPPGTDATAVGVYYRNNTVTVINRSFNGFTHIDFIKLDYTNGSLLSYNGWKPNISYPNPFYYEFLNSVNSIQLSNGNYCIYGLTFGDFAAQSTELPHFAVLEFDSNYNFLQGQAILAALHVNTSESRIKVDQDGKLLYFLTTFNPDWLNKDKYIGSASLNGYIYNQRKREYRNLEIFYDNFERFADQSYVYISTQATNGQSNFFLEYSKLHDSDTSSDCLGRQVSFSRFVPIEYTPYNFTWTSIQNNPLRETANQNNSTVPILYTDAPPCFQKNSCDTIRIHGSNTFCNTQQPVIFTAYKNSGCGSRVNWKIDSAAFQNFQQVNDTTISIQFGASWQGYLFAEINTSCGILRDSLLITVLNSPGQTLSLGADSSICPNNTIHLNAHSGFISYLWQDGSTDSTFTVTTPGTYWVETQNACNEIFRDTIIISAAPPPIFSIGPDLSKCNSDSLTVTATPGFLNYLWGPNYNINSTTSQSVFVFPAIDTFYTVIAEKTSGCFAYDTIYINVNNSAPVNLGTDTSFCSGDSLRLNAGGSFINYQWSNGNNSQIITVRNSGSYSVIATDTNNCKSKDTLRVINLFSNPVINLPVDGPVCTGSSFTLNAGSGFRTYNWSNGASSSSINVNTTGTYWVNVTDNNGCKGTDTTRITALLPLPAGFLQTDTFICSYSSIQLVPIIDFQNYLWSNGNTGESIVISQPGTYWLQVRDNNDCVGRDTIIVNPKQCLEGFYIPSAFTPNNDGVNDDFKPFLFGNVLSYRFIIYNRWGQKVFESTELGKGWKGVLASSQQSTNVFVWQCFYQFESKEPEYKKGTVLLIK